MFETTIKNRVIDNLVLLWAVYIVFETNVGTKENVENLYSRCFEGFPIFSFWRGKFLFETEMNDDENLEREIFKEADISLIGNDLERKKL